VSPPNTLFFFFFFFFFFFLSIWIINDNNGVNPRLEALGTEEEGPKVAVFQFYVNRLFKVNDADENVQLDFYLKINWQDKNYVGMSDDDFQEKENRFDEGWWEPGVEISNGIDLEKVRYCLLGSIDSL